MLETKIEEVRKKIKAWKKEGLTIGLVPTMGALHAGHLSLIKKSVEMCDKTVVSIFVNPIQFGPSEDLDKYPKTLDSDLKMCEEAGGGKCEVVVFAPTALEMYVSKNTATDNTPHPSPLPQGVRENDNLPQLSNDFLTYVVPPFFYTNTLCGKSRVGHFDGVCTVVMKLFNIVQPDYAFFGQKDAQQLVIIKKMVKDLNIPVDIISCPIVRDENGLALSSRNNYLLEEEKKEALALNKILTNIKACYKKGITDTKALFETASAFLNEHHDLEYLEFVDKDTLEEKTEADKNTLVLIALKLNNKVRLIDNCFIN